MKRPLGSFRPVRTRWRSVAAISGAAETDTFISRAQGCLFVESHSKPVHGPRPWLNRWQFEPVLILLVPFLFLMSLFLALLFFTLQSWIGDALPRLDDISIRTLLLLGHPAPPLPP